MKKKVIPILSLFFIFFISCNNVSSDSKPESTPKTATDSLMYDVMEGHNVAMGKMGKLRSMEKEVQNVIDSISKLPAKTKTALAPYKVKLDASLEELKSAQTGMDKWMDEFNMDSAINNMEERINYLANEKLKVTTVKESILTSLQKADSLIKEKINQ